MTAPPSTETPRHTSGGSAPTPPSPGGADLRQLADELAYVSGRVSREADRYLIISAVSALRSAAQGDANCGEKVVAAVAAKCAEIADRHSYAAAQAILQMFVPTGPSVPATLWRRTP